MTRESMDGMTTGRRALCGAAAALMIATAASAQAGVTVPGPLRIGFSTGGYVPLSSVILAADNHNTHIDASPAFSLDLQYEAVRSVSAYVNTTVAFSTIHLGSSVRPVAGPANQSFLVGATAGAVLASNMWEHAQPTLRLGGGIKWYSFDLSDSDSQIRPTVDVGLGLRGIGLGAIDVSAELRYLLSSFDQAKLPIRGISPQNQRQNDLVLAIGFGIRP